MKLILWCFFCFSLDFAAEGQENRYGLKGNSTCLRINHRYWQNKTVWRRFDIQLISNVEGVSPHFRNKMTLNFSDWSLTIHDLQENDSGSYKALDKWEQNIMAEYRLTVENTISKPVIKVNDFNSSSGECLAKVNCSVDGSWAMYDCDKGHCAETQSSLTSINITVTTVDRGIQCLVKNHVSSSHSETTHIMCHEKQHSNFQSPSPLIFWIIIAICVGVLLGLIVVLIVFIAKKRKSIQIHPQTHRNVQNPPTPTENTVTTIYDVPTRHPKAQRADSEEVMVQNQKEQRSGSDRTLKVKATVHQTEEADSGGINTVYCKLGEI